MKVLVYDGSFEGFLSAVFYVYEYRLQDVKICRRNHMAHNLFGKAITVESDEYKARRVWKGLGKKLSPAGLHCLYSSFLADSLKEEDNMLAYIRYAFSSQKNIENDYSNSAVMRAEKVEHMVSRERHRMKAFVRFKRTADDIYYAVAEPDFNVLPLIEKHFVQRFADQQWLIYDKRRRYGIYYNLKTVEAVTIQFNDGDGENIMHENEALYQKMWQQYFKSTNIASRKNVKLHLQHMPRRYWKYLVEKQP